MDLPGAEDGVSDMVGSVLLVALTVIGVVIVAALLLSAPLPGNVPAVSLSAGTTADGAFVLFHEGGDILEDGAYRLYVDVGNGPVDRTDEFLLDGDGVWSPGEALRYRAGEPDGRVIVTALAGGGETVIAEPRASGGIVPVVDEGGSTPGPGPDPGDVNVAITAPSDGGTVVFSGFPKYSATVRAAGAGGAIGKVVVLIESPGGDLAIDGEYTTEKGSDGGYYARIATNPGQLKKMTGREVMVRVVAYDTAGVVVAQDAVKAWIGAA